MELLLIDVSHLFWSAWHATVDKAVNAAFESTVEKVGILSSRYSHAAVCCDFPPYFRKEFFPEYKAQRDAPEPMAIEQFRRTKERLAADGHVIWEAQGYEADDVIASACSWAQGKKEIERVVIASSDKDLMQLVDSRVLFYSTRTDTIVDIEGIRAKFGVEPNQMRDLLALVGDKSDNVPGVPSVGAVKASKLLNQIGDIDEILDVVRHAPERIDPPSLRNALLANIDQILISRKLVTLRDDVAIDFETLFRPREAKQLEEVVEADFMDAIDEPSNGGEAAMGEPAAKEPMPEKVNGADVRPKAVTAITRVEPVEFSLALEPSSLEGAYRLAKALYNSRLYHRFGNADAIFAIIIRGREMGLGALTSLDGFHNVEGKPAMHAHLIVAQAKKHPDCEYFQMLEESPTSATYETKNRRNPRPTRHTYTLEQAKQAGLCPEEIRTVRPPGGKDIRGNWEKRPTEMLAKTCAAQLARLEYPDAALGLYCPEELEAS